MKKGILVSVLIALSLLIASGNLIEHVSACGVAVWEQSSDTNGDGMPDTPPVTLGPGANVNPTSTSFVRVKVTGLLEDCWVVSIELWEEDWASADDGPFAQSKTQVGNEATSSWITPPMQTDDAGSHSEWYAIVTVQCPEHIQVIKTPIINVPDGVVKVDEEVTSSESTVEAGGSVEGGTTAGPVTGKGNINVKKKSTTQRKRTVDFAATYKDPTVVLGLNLLSPLPSGWSITLDPSTFEIAPGGFQSVDLVIITPTEGEVLISVSSTSSPGGLVDETDPLLVKATTEPVGGIVVPVDKFGLLAPYIGLASTAMIGAVATAVYVRRVKHRKEKQ